MRLEDFSRVVQRIGAVGVSVGAVPVWETGDRLTSTTSQFQDGIHDRFVKRAPLSKKPRWRKARTGLAVKLESEKVCIGNGQIVWG